MDLATRNEMGAIRLENFDYRDAGFAARVRQLRGQRPTLIGPA